jgi:hypothetical protein
LYVLSSSRPFLLLLLLLLPLQALPTAVDYVTVDNNRPHLVPEVQVVWAVFQQALPAAGQQEVTLHMEPGKRCNSSSSSSSNRAVSTQPCHNLFQMHAGQQEVTLHVELDAAAAAAAAAVATAERQRQQQQQQLQQGGSRNGPYHYHQLINSLQIAACTYMICLRSCLSAMTPHHSWPATSQAVQHSVGHHSIQHSISHQALSKHQKSS